MNQRTARMLRKVALSETPVGMPMQPLYKLLKRRWLQTPWNQRAALRKVA